MTGYELYVFFLCLIVFVLLTGLFTVLIVWITRLLIRLIRGGLEDEAIKKEYYKTQCGCGGNCLSGIVDKIISVVFCTVFIVAFAFSLALLVAEEKKVGDIPVMRVVQSGSMSKKYEKNKYLFENNLNDQIQTFDIIITEELPNEFDLKLYDIVVYEVDDILVVHRIIKIEEPNEKHPDCRHFTLQGDNVQYPDKTPVLYEQMIAIYNGTRIPYIGSFISFMQSPAGWLCVLLIVVGSIAIPIVEKILAREREKRLIFIGELPKEGELLSEWQPAEALSETSKDVLVENEGLKQGSSAICGVETKIPVSTNKPVGQLSAPIVGEGVGIKKKTAVVKASTTGKAEIKVQKPKNEFKSKQANSGFVGKPTAVSTDDDRNVCDWFYDSLTRKEKNEFVELFVYKQIGGKVILLDYEIGRENYEFFRVFFENIAVYKHRVSEPLLKKMYRYYVKKF